MYDRTAFFNSVRESLFNGKLTQRQVDGMNHLIDVWERHFLEFAGAQSTPWLAYALATAFHETAFLMVPIEEYGQGEGMEYGQPAGPYGETYYGRGHVQLTWEANYQKAEARLAEGYDIEAPLHEHPEQMLEDEKSALIMYDGLIMGWFTGVQLSDFFNAQKEDPVNARKCVNGLDHAEVIEDYYWSFKDALQPVPLEAA